MMNRCPKCYGETDTAMRCHRCEAAALGGMTCSAFFRNDNDGPLTAGIEGKELVIRIGLGRLKWCLRNDDGEMRGCKVRSKVGMGKDIAAEMMRDDEVGATRLSDFLNRMAELAGENGSDHISLPNSRYSFARSVG